MEKFAQKNKSVLIGVAAAATVLGCFLLFGKTQKKDKKPQAEEKEAENAKSQDTTEKSQQQSSQQVSTQLSEKKESEKQTSIQNSTESVARKQTKKSAKELATQVEIKFNSESNTIELQTIAHILELSAELAKEEYAKYNFQNRKDRRRVQDSNRNQYEEYILEYNEEVENILTRASEQLLDELNLTKEVFEESIMTLMERGYYQQMYMLQAAVRQKIKEFLPATKDLTLKDTKDIIRFQISILENKPQLFKSIVERLQGNMENIQMIPLAINTILQDLIFIEFGVEEEDQMKNMIGPQILSDPEINDLLQRIEQAMGKLMQELGMMNPGMMGGMF